MHGRANTDVGDDSLKVADNVVKQIAAVNAIIFGRYSCSVIYL